MGFVRVPTTLDHIWTLQQKHIPDAEVYLDWICVTEKLWTAGQRVFAEGSAELALWVTEQLTLLRREWVNPMLQNLTGACIDIPKIGPGYNPSRPLRLERRGLA